MDSNLRDKLWDIFPDLIFFDYPVHDSSIIGLGLIEDQGYHFVTVYEEDLVLQNLINTSDSKDLEEAEQDALDWYHFNILGSYLGEHTPLFINNYLEEDIVARRCNKDYEKYFKIDDVKNLFDAYDIISKTESFMFVPLEDIEKIKSLL